MIERMRTSFLAALLVTLVSATGYWYVTTNHVCPAPLAYRLGGYDDRFSLPREEVREIIAQAALAWEAASGRDLFTESETSDFTIDFVFEDRQERRDQELAARTALDEKAARTATQRAEIEALEREFTDQEESYEDARARYLARVATYEQTVAELNRAGGGDTDTVARLEAERRALLVEADRIERSEQDIEALIETINQKRATANRIIAEYNAHVDTYNDQFAEAGAFTQGRFEGERIVIYSYADQAELRQVVAHELGHALGIGHVEEPQAIMYYLLEEQPTTLTITPDDLAALVAVCGEGDGWTQRVRALIRSFVTLFS
jgi:hypothetical protein